MIEREIPVIQPAHPVVQMDTRQIRETEGIHFLEEGEGTPMLFLHGIGGGAEAFAPQLARFGRSHRAIAWHMPGYAGSAPLPLVTIPALAASLGNFIAALGLDRPILVGHSLGGMIVQRLLAQAPHIARAAILSQTAAAFGGRDPAWAEAFVKSKLAPLDAGRSMAALAPEIVRDMAAPGADPANLARSIASFAAVPESTYRDMVLAMPGFDARDALPRIAIPTLVLAATADTAAPPPACEKMAAKIPAAKYLSLEGPGHLAHAETPKAFNQALEDFLHHALA